MINTWGELFAAIKVWWNTELDFKRKQLPEPSEYADILSLNRPPHSDHPDYWSNDKWQGLQRESMKRLSDSYFESLRTRMRQGEHLTQDELYRLQMDQHVKECNWSLEHQAEIEDNNLPDSDSEIK